MSTDDWLNRLDNIGEDLGFVPVTEPELPLSLTPQSSIKTPEQFYENPPEKFHLEHDVYGTIIGTLEGELEDRIVYVMRAIPKKEKDFSPNHVAVVEVYKYPSGHHEALMRLLSLDRPYRVISHWPISADKFTRDYSLDWTLLGFEQFGFELYGIF